MLIELKNRQCVAMSKIWSLIEYFERHYVRSLGKLNTNVIAKRKGRSGRARLDLDCHIIDSDNIAEIVLLSTKQQLKIMFLLG